MRPGEWSRDLHTGLVLELNKNDYFACAAYLHDLCLAAPEYNAGDLSLSRYMPSLWHDALLPDIPLHTPPPDILSVCMPQAAVLLLRECFDARRNDRAGRLAAKMIAVNSRTCSSGACDCFLHAPQWSAVLCVARCPRP